MSRWIGFLLAIAVGVGLGLLYGWVINPVEYTDTAPNTLRIDYKTDYVLMVAEAYQTEKDLPLALRRLALLGNAPPEQVVQQALLFARQAGYLETDLAKMQDLLTALQALSEVQGQTTP